MVERLARWMWDRWKHRWGRVSTGFATAILTVVLLPLSVLVYSVAMELSWAESIQLWVLLAIGVGAYFYTCIRLIGREHMRRFEAWGRGERDDVAGTRASAIRGVPDIAPRVLFVAGLPSSLGATIGITWYFDDTVGSGVALGILCVGVCLAAFVAVVVSFDLLLRPLREEVDLLVPVSEPIPTSYLSVRNRLTAGAAAIGWGCCLYGGGIAGRFDTPAGRLGVAGALGLTFAPLLVIGLFRIFVLAPVLRPLDDLRRGTRRVAAGVFDGRLPVTSDDELGDLVRSFNVMQAGLLERERLHSAFGSYVDPALARRLMEQGDDLFAGEEVEVTVFFADVRNFTGFAETVEPREAVDRLNRLFSLVVPILRDHHGHANKYLGDGVLAVFGAPEDVDDHADCALAAALEIQRQAACEFGGTLHLGIGINTGKVIAGTVGGGGKLEFTLIGDAVNVAARVEECTKVTGDAILLTQATLDSLRDRPAQLLPRGDHAFRGKTAPTCLYAVPVG